MSCFSRGKLPKTTALPCFFPPGLLRQLLVSLAVRCLRMRGDRRRVAYVVGQRVARGFFLFARALSDRELNRFRSRPRLAGYESFSTRGGEKQERLCRYPVCVFSFAFRFCNRLPLEIFNSSAVPAASAPSAPHVFFCAAGDASAPESAMLSRTSTGRTYPRGTFLCARFIETRILTLTQPARARPQQQLRRFDAAAELQPATSFARLAYCTFRNYGVSHCGDPPPLCA